MAEHDGVWLWLDDRRPAPPEYDVHVFTANDAIKILETGRVTRISLDHDLGDEAIVGSGYRVACWIEEAAFEARVPCLAWAIHSQNNVGVNRMRAALQNADLYWRNRRECDEIDALPPAG